MKLRILIVLSFGLALLFLSAGTAQAQASSDSNRRVVRKLVPTYPDLARKMNLTGTVKVRATVARDGAVRSVEAIGGNPLLIRASEDALYKWKFAPAAAETKELIELHFNP
jgi:TonB family protein